jgi:rfaE bifunctional protein nucleotidyltransferase chain/domain
LTPDADAIPDPARKIMSRAEASQWRRGRTGPVVFTNGVFDILHRGHVSYLCAARAEGSVLVVGLNSDSSARSLGKGPERPVNTAADRAFVLAALECVDAVVEFSEPTPLELIRLLEPDVLAKGADYEIDAIVGAAFVTSRGGRVVRIPLASGYSTTAIIERARRAQT